MTTLNINRRNHDVVADPETPLLGVLRDHIGLTGTKYGCRIAHCGACTVLLDGVPVRSCVLAVGDVRDRPITTIEGLSADNNHPLQKAWIEEDVPQCGYCQSGQIMSAAGLLAETDTPGDDDIDAAMTGNICRCGTFGRIRKAIQRAARPDAGGLR